MQKQIRPIHKMRAIDLAALQPMRAYNWDPQERMGSKMRVMVLVMIAAVFSILAIKLVDNSLGGGRLMASPREIALG
ncbi:hypothetical protein [Rhizobium wuzhouense]|uniref:hypothetical protein n=1 Tax=Rhizobium wuzhouense TaxID=1986026 RepID=UPI000DA21257|nr:hypothetical protein [Rhizobium wuzhouense]